MFIRMFAACPTCRVNLLSINFRTHHSDDRFRMDNLRCRDDASSVVDDLG